MKKFFQEVISWETGTPSKGAFVISVGRRIRSHNAKKPAFTLAEVLITLVIIGVVAAITVPILHNDTADKKWNVARQKAQATIGEAFRLMTVNGEIDRTKTTEQFVEKVLSKYLKLERTCSRDKYSDCGFPSSIKQADGKAMVASSPDNWSWNALSPTKKVTTSNPAEDSTNWGGLGDYTDTTYDTASFFRTLDGFSVAFLYNPNCAANEKDNYRYTNLVPATTGKRYYAQQSMDVVCMMGVYDMNGKAGPNQVGKDIGFVGSFYNGYTTRAVAVSPHSKEIKYDETPYTGDCWDRLYNFCDNLDKDKSWIMPDLDETSLLYLNSLLVRGSNEPVTRWFLSRSPSGAPGYFRHVRFHVTHGGNRFWSSRFGTNSSGPYVRCVRRTALK